MEKAPTNSVLNVKALVGAFTQETAFSVIVKTDVALHSTSFDIDISQPHHPAHLHQQPGGRGPDRGDHDGGGLGPHQRRGAQGQIPQVIPLELEPKLEIDNR